VVTEPAVVKKQVEAMEFQVVEETAQVVGNISDSK